MDVFWEGGGRAGAQGTTQPNTWLFIFTGLSCQNDKLETLC